MIRRAAALLCTALLAGTAQGRGVSPYLPLNQSPEIESQIEKVLMLGEVPLLSRPVPAAAVLDALPRVCERDPVLCRQVRAFLGSYMRAAGLTRASLAGYADSGEPTALPNRRGMMSDSAFEASASAYWQPSDYVLLNAGLAAYEDEIVPAASVISLGYEYAQLDIGYRDHWFSPMRDSARLIGTQAETMPSITLSNYTPITRLGIRYVIFAARMSESDRIGFLGMTTSGHPRLTGLHVSVEPVPGWSLGVNRLMQFGGGERGGESFGDFIDALFRPSVVDNTGTDADFGNQLASITSRFLIQTATPFAVYFEYAGEDTSHGDDFRLGNAALSAGIYFPALWRDFELTVEAGEWQNGWYTHHIYGDGLRHHGNVIGHWSGDWRRLGDGVGGRSLMARLAWTRAYGGRLEATYRTLANESYTAPEYERAHALEVRYSRSWGDLYVGGEAHLGRNAFGESYSRAGAFIRF